MRWGLLGFVLLWPGAALAVLSPQEKIDLRHDKALHFVMAVGSVTSEKRKEARVDGDMQCHVEGTVTAVRNGGRKIDRIPFTYKEGQPISFDVGCNSDEFKSAPGAFSVKASGLAKAGSLEVWGEMALFDVRDGSITTEGVASILPDFQWRYIKDGKPFFTPFDLTILP